MMNTWDGWNKKENNVEITGISDTFNHSPMAMTLVHFRWLVSMERNTLALDGAKFIALLKMNGWERISSMDGRFIQAIQCGAPPLRGLCPRQEKTSRSSMRWSRLGQCRSDLEVWRHLERRTHFGWNDSRELPNPRTEVGQFPESHLHGVQANEKTPSTSAWVEGHKRWIGADHGEIWGCIHQETWQAGAETGNWHCRSWDMALASCNQSSYGTFKNPRRWVHRRWQDFLPDEPGCGLYSWRRISLHYIWMYSTDFPRRTTSWRRRRPHQHVLRAFRALGRAEPNGIAIQEDW